MSLYILDEGKNAVPVVEKEFNNWLSQTNNIEERTVCYSVTGNNRISTVFLCVDYAPESENPLLFETVIMNDKSWSLYSRYSTWKEANSGHHEAVKNLTR